MGSTPTKARSAERSANQRAHQPRSHSYFGVPPAPDGGVHRCGAPRKSGSGKRRGKPKAARGADRPAAPREHRPRPPAAVPGWAGGGACRPSAAPAAGSGGQQARKAHAPQPPRKGEATPPAGSGRRAHVARPAAPPAAQPAAQPAPAVLDYRPLSAARLNRMNNWVESLPRTNLPDPADYYRVKRDWRTQCPPEDPHTPSPVSTCASSTCPTLPFTPVPPGSGRTN
eukprot:TRINITY_DN38669_c1_g1_i2.p1 TRINITY_DN38669_c1_g1~~TRINITY_DN38669_c1_g1_i2.p1  ORF type:complete len:227 (+),score=23.33 TRINITY_DN38669_c1_g1_i2:150-830(+)